MSGNILQFPTPTRESVLEEMRNFYPSAPVEYKAGNWRRADENCRQQSARLAERMIRVFNPDIPKLAERFGSKYGYPPSTVERWLRGQKAMPALRMPHVWRDVADMLEDEFST